MNLRSSCLSCDSSALTQIIDLGMHSFADRFISQENYFGHDPAYPLSCSICDDCGFIQLDSITSPEARYNDFVYSYTSSNSQSSIAYWASYAKSVLSRLSSSPSNVLEVGSNDGQLLSEFVINGISDVTGVDASPDMCLVANNRGIHTYNSFFGNNSSRLDNHCQDYLDRKYDLIVANNVLNHSNDPLDFVRTAASLLSSSDSYFVFEVPYWGALVRDSQFDQIYHEHVSYLTLHNSSQLARIAGLQVTHAEITPYHGGSIRVFCQLGSGRNQSAQYSQLLDDEMALRLCDVSTYKSLMRQISINRQRLLKVVYSFIDSNRPVVCIGAAAKANTFLTYMGLNSSFVQFITDTSESKIGKYTPLTRIPIRVDADISTLDSPLCIVTSWNLFSILEPLIKQTNPTATVISSRQIL